MNIRRSIIIAELWRPEVARRYVETKFIFAFFCKNDPILENFQNSVPKGFISTPIDVLCSNFVKFGRQEIGKVVHSLPDKKKQTFAWLSHSRYCADLAQNLPEPAPRMYSDNSRFHPNRFFRRSYIRTREHHQSVLEVNPIFG